MSFQCKQISYLQELINRLASYLQELVIETESIKPV